MYRWIRPDSASHNGAARSKQDYISIQEHMSNINQLKQDHEAEINRVQTELRQKFTAMEDTGSNLNKELRYSKAVLLLNLHRTFLRLRIRVLYLQIQIQHLPHLLLRRCHSQMQCHQEISLRRLQCWWWALHRLKCLAWLARLLLRCWRR